MPGALLLATTSVARSMPHMHCQTHCIPTTIYRILYIVRNDTVIILHYLLFHPNLPRP